MTSTAKETRKSAAIAAKEGASVAIPKELGGTWGSEGASTEDLLVPRILLAQGLSKYVTAGKAAIGDIVRSTDHAVLAKRGETVEFIPLGTFKQWRIMANVGGKWKFKRIEPVTPENINSDWEWEENGELYRRDNVLNFYVILPEDLSKETKAREALAKGELPDPDDVVLPYTLSFTRTSYTTGKMLSTHFQKAKHLGVPPAITVFNLSTTIETNDDGSFTVAHVEKSRKTEANELAFAKRWHDTIRSSNVTVDEEEAVDTEGETLNATDNF